MRVLQIFNKYRYFGGEETSVERIFRHLGIHHDVDRCLFDSNEWAKPNGPTAVGQAWRMWNNPEAIRLIRRQHQAFQPDVWLLHNVFPVGSAGVYLEAKKLKVPVVQYVHNYRPYSVNGHLWAKGKVEASGLRKNFFPEILAGTWQDSRLKTAWYAAIMYYLHLRGGYESINAWVAISDFVKEKFIEAGVQPEKLFVLPHAWEIVEPSQTNPRDDGYLLYLGRLSDVKGVDVLVKAWIEMNKSMNDDAPDLVLAGDGELRSYVEEKSREYSGIKYKGMVSGEEKRALLRNCRAMVAPSLWWEPLGLVTYEAYEYGKPMLGAASGGLSETVFHGKTGFLHTPGDVHQLANQMVEIAKNEKKARDMGLNGRIWLEKNTDSDLWIAKMNRILSIVKTGKKA